MIHNYYYDWLILYLSKSIIESKKLNYLLMITYVIEINKE